MTAFKTIADAAREELRRIQTETASPEGEILFPTAAERAARAALFSADIDAAFHKAKCSVCQQMNLAGAEAAA